MKNKWKIMALGILSIGLLGACGTKNKETTTQDGKLSIVTTFYPVYEFTKQVVGNEANVKLLVPAGSEPHDYEPSAKDIAAIQSADVFVYHNPNMEGWVKKASKSWSKGKPEIIEATQGIKLMEMNGENEDHDSKEDSHSHTMDPHVWLAPSLAIKEVASIEDQLIKLYPDKKEQFTKNAETYIAKLTELDNEFKTSLSQAKQKNFVTQHAAFSYLAKEYGLNQVAIAGLSPEQEPSPTRLAELKKYVTDNEIKIIYFEENANDKVAKTLANEVKVNLLVLNPLESLTTKQMKAGEDYISVMKENLKALEQTTNHSGKEIQQEKPHGH